jgi:hypothetical protein
VAIDTVLLNNNPLFPSFSGTTPPSGFSLVTGSTFGTTNGATSGLSPTSGGTFAYLDTTGTAAPIFDTVDTRNPANGHFDLGASRMLSPFFTVHAGDTLSLNMVFLTNDGANFDDYAVAALQAIPEPPGLILLGSGLIGLAGAARFRQGQRARR